MTEATHFAASTPHIEIVSVSGPELITYADELAALLVETVDGGASVGFLAPLDRGAAAAWWRGAPPRSTRATSASGSPGTASGWREPSA